MGYIALSKERNDEDSEVLYLPFAIFKVQYYIKLQKNIYRNGIIHPDGSTLKRKQCGEMSAATSAGHVMSDKVVTKTQKVSTESDDRQKSCLDQDMPSKSVLQSPTSKSPIGQHKENDSEVHVSSEENSSTEIHSTLEMEVDVIPGDNAEDSMDDVIEILDSDSDDLQESENHVKESDCQRMAVTKSDKLDCKGGKIGEQVLVTEIVGQRAEKDEDMEDKVVFTEVKDRDWRPCFQNEKGKVDGLPGSDACEYSDSDVGDADNDETDHKVMGEHTSEEKEPAQSKDSEQSIHVRKNNVGCSGVESSGVASRTRAKSGSRVVAAEEKILGKKRKSKDATDNRKSISPEIKDPGAVESSADIEEEAEITRAKSGSRVLAAKEKFLCKKRKSKDATDNRKSISPEIKDTGAVESSVDIEEEAEKCDEVSPSMSTYSLRKRKRISYVEDTCVDRDSAGVYQSDPNYVMKKKWKRMKQSGSFDDNEENMCFDLEKDGGKTIHETNKEKSGEDKTDPGYLVEEEFETVDGGGVNHVKTEAEENEYTCVVCLSTFSTAGELEDHNKIHRNIDVHKCGLCNKSFLAAHHLRRHVRECRLTFGLTACDLCGYMPADNADSESHTKGHRVQNPYPCPRPECKSRLPSYDSVVNHFKNKHCKYCVITIFHKNLNYLCPLQARIQEFPSGGPTFRKF